MKRTLIGVLVLVLLFLLVSYVRNLLQLAHKVKYAILFVNLDKLEFCHFHIAGAGFGCGLYSNYLFIEMKINEEQAPVVQTLDSAFHRINHYPADKY